MSSPLKSSPLALVTGTTGRHAATGPRIVRLLLEQGLAVRAMVDRPDERSSSLKDLGHCPLAPWEIEACLQPEIPII